MSARITRRTAIKGVAGGTAAVAVGALATSAAALPAIAADNDARLVALVDKVIDVRAAHQEGVRQYTAIWDRLPEWVAGPPRVLIQHGPSPVYARSDSEVDQLATRHFGGIPGNCIGNSEKIDELRALYRAKVAELKAELQAYRERQNAEQERAGIKALDDELDRLHDEMSQAVDEAHGMPARSGHGLRAKARLHKSHLEHWHADWGMDYPGVDKFMEGLIADIERLAGRMAS